MDGSDRRRAPRYKVRLPARIQRGAQNIALQTQNIALGGVFLRTDATLPERTLVQLTLSLPPAKEELIVHGMVVHTVRPDNGTGRAPGVAFQFHAMNARAQTRWEEFLAWLAAEYPAAEEESVSFTSAGIPDPIRRQHERVGVEVEVRFKTVDQLFTLYTQDISAGGMFLKTDLQVPVGSNLIFQIVHPESGATFPLSCIVRRCVDEVGKRGLGVEFINLDERRRSDLFGFVISLAEFGKHDGLPLSRAG